MTTKIFVSGTVIDSDWLNDVDAHTYDQEAAAHVSSNISYMPAGTGAVTTTVQSKLWESVSVLDFGAVGDGVADDTVAIQAAIDSGNSFDAPGTFLVSAPLVITSAGQIIRGFGYGKTTFKADPAFVGSSVLVYGNKVSTSVTASVGGHDVVVDCSAVDGLNGVECYGIRDGSTFSNVYVTGVKNAPGILTNMAGNGTGVAAGKMCEGVQFQNCHVITSEDQAAVSLWQLDGLFESQLIGCKALGSSVATITDTNGFRIGGISEVRGVTLIGCSAGNLATSGNVGIRYGEYARECWDQFTTFENIVGNGVYFHGSSVSGTLLPFDCRSISPRPYNIPTAGVLNPLYRFGDCNGCYAGVVSYYNSTKVWGRFDAIVSAQTNNFIEIEAGTSPATVLSTIISFDASAATSNVVYGFSSDSSASRKYIRFNAGLHTERYEANGFSEQNDGSWTSINLPTSDKMRWRSNTLSSLLEIDAGAGTITPKIRTVMGGAWDSASLMQLGGYRLWVDATGDLRIKNGAPTSDTDGTVVGTQS